MRFQIFLQRKNGDLSGCKVAPLFLHISHLTKGERRRNNEISGCAESASVRPGPLLAPLSAALLGKFIKLGVED